MRAAAISGAARPATIFNHTLETAHASEHILSLINDPADSK
jgi:hypothetical protein